MNKSKIESFPLRTEAKNLILEQQMEQMACIQRPCCTKKTPKNLQYWNLIQHGKISCYGRNVGPELLQRESLTHLLDTGEMSGIINILFPPFMVCVLISSVRVCVQLASLHQRCTGAAHSCDLLLGPVLVLLEYRRGYGRGPARWSTVVCALSMLSWNSPKVSNLFINSYTQCAKNISLT